MCGWKRVSLLALLVFPQLMHAQQSVQYDTQALALLQTAVLAMGGAAPADSVATGNVAIVAGSSRETGTFRITTRGLDQTAEHFQTSASTRHIVYSRLRASEGNNPRLNLELAVTAQCALFPLPFLAAALQNPDVSLTYIGAESLDGRSADHIRLRNTFASQPELASVSKFTVTEIWLDSVSRLPVKISYYRRRSASDDALAVEITFADFRTVSGYQYPFTIHKSLNGTPWAALSVQSVGFNTGLTDNDFAVSQVLP